jgi:hypothetical protein
VFKVATGKPSTAAAGSSSPRSRPDKSSTSPFGFQNAVGANASSTTAPGLKVSATRRPGSRRTTASRYFYASSYVNNSASTVTKTNRAARRRDVVRRRDLRHGQRRRHLGVHYKVDGQYLRDTNNAIIRHAVTIASATEMQMFLGVKLGAATNNDTLTADLWLGKQKVF